MNQAPDSPADQSTAEPLLDINTMIERPRVSIDGASYEILNPGELSIIDSHRFGKWGRRINALAEAEGDEEEAELTKLVDKVARKVAVGIPDEVYARLSGKNKLAIADVFTGLLLGDSLGVAGAIAKASGIPILPIGAASFPGSSASTAATLGGGWKKRLYRSFGRS